MQESNALLWLLIPVALGLLYGLKQYKEKRSFNADNVVNGREFQQIRDALHIAVQQPELASMLNFRQILVASNLRSGKVNASGLARKGVIYIDRRYLAKHPKEWHHVLRLILHEQGHIEHKHKGQKPHQEDEANAFKQHWLDVLGV